MFHSAKACGLQLSPVEENLSLAMLQAWATFAHGAMPTNVWPEFNNQTSISMGWTIPPVILNGYHQSNCEFWDSIGYDF